MNRNIYKKNRKRHSRTVRNSFFNKNLYNLKRLFSSNNGYNLVFFVLLFLIPIYPTFASFAYNNNQYDFLRNDIDETSIIESYYADEDEINVEKNQNTPILEASDSFLSINSILNDERDLSGTNEIVDYEIKPGDNISSIAYKFKVSNNSIYWANNFSKNHIIHPGDIIKIPPTSGLIHQVKKGDTVSSLAKLYSVDSEKILTQNLLTSDDNLIVGNVLVIPGAIKKVQKPTYNSVSSKSYAKTSGNVANSGYSFSNYAKSEYVNASGKYKLVRRKPQHTFYWGNCTRYVGQYKNVNWGGNANQWLKNAQAKGHATGSTPTLGSIVVFNGRGYNPRYGHVGIVMDIVGSNIIVSDMNYRRLNEITYRKVPKNDRAIKGYIYVD